MLFKCNRFPAPLFSIHYEKTVHEKPFKPSSSTLQNNIKYYILHFALKLHFRFEKLLFDKNQFFLQKKTLTVPLFLPLRY